MSVFLFVLVFILYGNTIKNEYALDDEFVTYNNAVVAKGFNGLKEIFTSRYTEGSGASSEYGYRPVVKATFAIEHQFFGQNPHVSHFINILIYALTGLILFRLLSKLLSGYNPVLPLAITLLFLAHPVHTEAVASLKNRDQLLSFLGCLMSLKFYLRYNSEQRFRDLLLMIFFFIIAYFSKADAITFFAVFPLVSWYFTDHRLKHVLISVGSLLLILVTLFIMVKLYLPDSSRHLDFYENPLFFVKDFSTRTATAFYSLYYYMRLLVIPHPLVHYYGFDMIPLVSWSHVIPIVSLLFYLIARGWALLNLKSKHILSFAVLFFICTLSIYSNLAVPVVGIVGERFLYVPSLGFVIALTFLLFKIFRIPLKTNSYSFSLLPSRLIVLSTTILVIWTGKTIARNTSWKDHYTLYTNDIRYQERSAKAHDLLASHLTMKALSETDPVKRREMITDAIRYYKQALAIYPDFVAANNSLGSVYCNFNQDFSAAIPYLSKAVNLDHSFAQASYNLAFAFERSGKPDLAIKQYEDLIENYPSDFPLAYSNLGVLYNQKGSFTTAVELNVKAMKVFPGSDLPYISIGQLYLSRQDTVNAIAWWEKAVQVSPENRKLASGLSQYFFSKNQAEKARYYSNIANR